MSDQRGFSNDGTEPTGPRKSNDGDDDMKKKREDVAHGRMVSNVKESAIQAFEEFATHTVKDRDVQHFLRKSLTLRGSLDSVRQFWTETDSRKSAEGRN